MNHSQLRLFSTVLNTDLVYESPDGTLTPYFDTVAHSPLMHSEALRQTLRKGAIAQAHPFLLQGEFHTYFAAMRAEDGILFMGPMCHELLRKAKRRLMFRSYEVEDEDGPDLPAYTLPEIRNMVALVSSTLKSSGGGSDNSGGPDSDDGFNNDGGFDNLGGSGEAVGDNAQEPEDLLRSNRLLKGDALSERKSQNRYLVREEELTDAEGFRHSYHEEQLLMQAIREGRKKDAVRLAENMDRDTGMLSNEQFRHRRNLGMIGISLCARAAIDAGVRPEVAYRVSGYYINKLDVVQTETDLLHYRNLSIEELCDQVKKILDKPRATGYVERAKDYIAKHYREKIYLEDVAETLEITPTYLSRLFKKETGTALQDYINEVRVERASNLLRYSDSSLSEIAEYVHFPSQSYFGKIFKKCTGMTPRAYRDRYQTIG